jgi:hypothetical protein
MSKTNDNQYFCPIIAPNTQSFRALNLSVNHFLLSFEINQ